MTKQIERAYRNNRRRSWSLIAAVVALAAVAIPIASGAPDKTYTLGYAVATQAAPVPPSTQTICTSAQSVTLFLTNTAKSASLGSTEIVLPRYATGASAFKKVTPSSAEVAVTGSTFIQGVVSPMPTDSKLLLSNLGLGKYGSVRIVVTVASPTVGTATITAVVKQSNDFNDNSTGTANEFSRPTFPTLTVQDCSGTISGIVWNDVDESGLRTGNGVPDKPEEALLAGWKVKLYDGAVPVGTPATTDSNGFYTLSNVPLNKDYVVCLEAKSGSGDWVQTTPLIAPNTPAPGWTATGLTQCGPALPDGYSLTGSNKFTANVTANFGVASAVNVGCSPRPTVTQKFEKSTVDSTYTVWLPPAVCDSSPSGLFVFEAYALGDVERVANLHGENSALTVAVVEQMEWKFDGDSQPGAPGVDRYLKYKDLEGQAVRDMPYCGVNPLSNPNFDPTTDTPLVTEPIATETFPDDHTSCLISTVEDADRNRVDLALTKVDGYRAFP